MDGQGETDAIRFSAGSGWDAAALDGIANKWAVLIIVSLAAGSLRFAEIKRVVEGIPQKALTSNLPSLERDGLIRKTLQPGTTPQSRYELTTIGRHALIPLRALADWADHSREAVAAARAEFDRLRVKAVGTDSASITDSQSRSEERNSAHTPAVEILFVR